MSLAKSILGRGGKVVAYVQDNTSEIVLMAPGGKVLAKYLKVHDQTITAGGELVGYGNQLMTVLK